VNGSPVWNVFTASNANGWGVEVCTDEQVKHAHNTVGERSAQQYIRVTVMTEAESNAVNTTFQNKSKDKNNFYLQKSWRCNTIIHRPRVPQLHLMSHQMHIIAALKTEGDWIGRGRNRLYIESFSSKQLSSK